MDVSVNSTIIQVSSRKKGSPLLCWQSPIDGKDDLLDLLISRIQDPTLFQFTKQRFGDGTAASPETDNKVRIPQKFDKKVLELFAFDVLPYKDSSGGHRCCDRRWNRTLPLRFFHRFIW